MRQEARQGYSRKVSLVLHYRRPCGQWKVPENFQQESDLNRPFCYKDDLGRRTEGEPEGKRPKAERLVLTGEQLRTMRPQCRAHRWASSGRHEQLGPGRSITKWFQLQRAGRTPGRYRSVS